MAFRERGHNAFSCDIQEPSGGHPEWHIKGDAINFINPIHFQSEEVDGLDDMCIPFRAMDGMYHEVPKWDLIIAHPPCTYLSNAGACRLYPRKGVLNHERYEQGMNAKAFFMRFYDADCERICIENPIPSTVFDMPRYSQTIQPFWFGEPYSKKTCLWLKGLAPLKPTNLLTEYKPYVSCGTSANKGNPDKAGFSRAGGAAIVRSKTFWGVARAMAEQWGVIQ